MSHNRHGLNQRRFALLHTVGSSSLAKPGQIYFGASGWHKCLFSMQTWKIVTCYNSPGGGGCFHRPSAAIRRGFRGNQISKDSGNRGRKHEYFSQQQDLLLVFWSFSQSYLAELYIQIRLTKNPSINGTITTHQHCLNITSVLFIRVLCV